MKRLIYFFLLLLLAGCTTYQEFVKVSPRTNVPKSTQSLIAHTSIDSLKLVFKSSGVLIKTMEGGFITDEILLDEGTRAMYKAVQFDDQVQLTAYWGITQKVKSQMVAWAGADAASAYDVTGWDKVLYDPASWRPKKVFDYLVQLVEARNIPYAFK